MGRCFPQGFLQVLLEDVHGTGDESSFGTDSERNGVEGTIGGAEGRGLGFLSDFGGRRVLAFGQTVNFVVEHQDFQADVAAQHVDRVIAADGKRIAVAGSDPDVEVRANELDAGGDWRERGRG